MMKEPKKEMTDYEKISLKIQLAQLTIVSAGLLTVSDTDKLNLSSQATEIVDKLTNQVYELLD